MKNKNQKDFWNSDNGESINIQYFYNHFKVLTSELKIDEDEECLDFLNDFDSRDFVDSPYVELNEAFTLEEIRHAIKLLGRNKACSLDNIFTSIS